MKYEHTYLSVRVTATGNTAREMSRWSDAARTEYLRDQIVMFLNGRRPDFCVECVDLEAVELQRQQALHATESDGGGVQVAATAAEAPKPAPAPATQGGEWPKWRQKYADRVWRLDNSFCDGVRFGANCAPVPFSGQDLMLVGREITPAQAARWLRENGHAKVADELESDMFEPIGTVPVVGDRIIRTTKGSYWKTPYNVPAVPFGELR